MKAHLLKENLHQAIALAARFSSQKAQLPVLSHLSIEATRDGVFVKGTDLAMGIRLRVGGKVIEQGKVVVPAKILAELVAALPLGPVELSSAGEGGLEVRAGKTRAKLQGMAVEEFPDFLSDEEGVFLGAYDVKAFGEAVERVGFAASVDESRPVLTGVLWQLKKGGLVATDGYRLSLMEEVLDRQVKLGEETLLVGASTMREALRAALEFGEDKVGVRYLPQKRQIVFVSGELMVVGRVLEGEFPKFEAIIPESLGLEVAVDRAGLLAAVRSAAIFARDSANIIRFGIQKDGLTVSANAPQVGENLVGMDVEFLAEGEGTIAFNSKYLIDFLSHATSEQVVVGVNDSLKPGVFRERERKNYRHVIMPVRVHEN